MQVGPTRRAVLALAAGLLARPAASAQGAGTLVPHAVVDTGNRVLNPPAFADGLIVFSGDRTVGAVDPGTGALVWRTELPDGHPAHFRPRPGGGLAVIGGRRGLAAYETATGQLLWRRNAAIQSGVPSLSDGAIHVGDGHEIVALDAASGALLWRHAGVPDTLASYAPVVAGGLVLAGPGDGRLYGLAIGDGRPAWIVDRSEAWQYLRQLHVHDGILVAGSYKEKLFGIAVADGRALWEFNAGNFINSHHVAGGTAYLWSPTGHIHAIDAASGKVAWRHETTDYDDSAGNWASMLAELIVHDGRLLALDMADVLHVLSVTDGRELARHPVGMPIRHAVLPLPDGMLAFPGMSGRLLIAGSA